MTFRCREALETLADVVKLEGRRAGDGVRVLRVHDVEIMLLERGDIEALSFMDLKSLPPCRPGANEGVTVEHGSIVLSGGQGA